MFSSDDSHPRGAEPEFEKKEVYYMPNVKNQETLVKIKEDLDGEIGRASCRERVSSPV